MISGSGRDPCRRCPEPSLVRQVGLNIEALELSNVLALCAETPKRDSPPRCRNSGAPENITPVRALKSTIWVGPLGATDSLQVANNYG